MNTKCRTHNVWERKPMLLWRSAYQNSDPSFHVRGKKCCYKIDFQLQTKLSSCEIECYISVFMNDVREIYIESFDELITRFSCPEFGEAIYVWCHPHSLLVPEFWNHDWIKQFLQSWNEHLEHLITWNRSLWSRLVKPIRSSPHALHTHTHTYKNFPIESKNSSCI